MVESKVESLVTAALKFNPEDNYSEEAERLLEKAININENCIDAWLNLAYTRFNKGSVETSLKAFEEAEKLCDATPHPSHKDVLCGLSVIVRHTSGVEDLNIENDLFDKSIEYAKKAITLDVNYAKAWYTLGMAHLSRFFKNRKNPKDLESSLQAFKFSEKKYSKPYADLYLNRGTVYRFLMAYSSARQDYEKAITLDPKLESAKSFLREINDVWYKVKQEIEKGSVGKAEKRRVEERAAKIPSSSSTVKQIIKESTTTPSTTPASTSSPSSSSSSSPSSLTITLPPDETSSSSSIPQSITITGPSSSSSSSSSSLPPSPLSSISACVIRCVTSPSNSPQIFVLSDREDTRFVLALYDVGSDVAKEGAIVTVAKPVFNLFSYDGKTMYPMLLIDNHSLVTIDGQPIPLKSKALPVIQ